MRFSTVPRNRGWCTWRWGCSAAIGRVGSRLNGMGRYGHISTRRMGREYGENAYFGCRTASRCHPSKRWPCAMNPDRKQCRKCPTSDRWGWTRSWWPQICPPWTAPPTLWRPARILRPQTKTQVTLSAWRWLLSLPYLTTSGHKASAKRHLCRVVIAQASVHRRQTPLVVRRPNHQIRLAGTAHQERTVARHTEADNFRVQPMGHGKRGARRYGSCGRVAAAAVQFVLLDAICLRLVNE